LFKPTLCFCFLAEVLAEPMRLLSHNCIIKKTCQKPPEGDVVHAIFGVPPFCKGNLTISRVNQWRSQARAHTGLGPGVSSAKVLRRRVCTATRLCTVALRQYCQCALDCSTPHSQTLSCLGTRTTLVQSRSQALFCGGECMHIVRCM